MVHSHSIIISFNRKKAKMKKKTFSFQPKVLILTINIFKVPVTVIRLDITVTVFLKFGIFLKFYLANLNNLFFITRRLKNRFYVKCENKAKIDFNVQV
jgi:hypothetical protein